MVTKVDRHGFGSLSLERRCIPVNDICTVRIYLILFIRVRVRVRVYNIYTPVYI